MSAKFYDKHDIEVDKQLQSLNERLNSIRRAYPKEAGYLYVGEKVFNHYDDKVRGRVVDLLTQDCKLMRAGTIVGVLAGTLAIWELFQGVKVVLRWVGNKIAQRDEVEVSPS